MAIPGVIDFGNLAGGNQPLSDFDVSFAAVQAYVQNAPDQRFITLDSTLGLPGQLIIRGATDNNKQLSLGYNTTSEFGVIQAQHLTVGYKPLCLNPSGGNVLIGTETDNGTGILQVNGISEADHFFCGDFSWINAANLQSGWISGWQNTVNVVSSSSSSPRNAGLFASETIGSPAGQQLWSLGAIGRQSMPAANGVSSSYALYIEAYKEQGTHANSNIQGFELDIINRLQDGNQVTSYVPDAFGIGLVEGQRIIQIQLGTKKQYTASVALNIVGDGEYGHSIGAWGTSKNNFAVGLNISNYAIVNGGAAISLASAASVGGGFHNSGHQIIWYCDDSNPGAIIRSDCAASANMMQLIFSDQALYIQDSGGGNLFEVASTGVVSFSGTPTAVGAHTINTLIPAVFQGTPGFIPFYT